MDLTRRSWLAAAGAAGLAGGGATPAHAAAVKLYKGSTILFQGDSITDAGRDRERTAPNDARAFGRGYPLLLGSDLLASNPDLELSVYNRGISGNKVPDLDARWEEDAVALEPDVLSILIGVNDIWHKLNGRYDGTVETYESGYNDLIGRTKKALPGVQLVICEPFVLRCGAVNDTWFPEMDQRRAAAKRVAERARALWVPFQTMFDAAVKKAPPEYWAADGVHPSMAGHRAMADLWLKTTGLG